MADRFSNTYVGRAGKDIFGINHGDLCRNSLTFAVKESGEDLKIFHGLECLTSFPSKDPLEDVLKKGRIGSDKTAIAITKHVDAMLAKSPALFQSLLEDIQESFPNLQYLLIYTLPVNIPNLRRFVGIIKNNLLKPFMDDQLFAMDSNFKSNPLSITLLWKKRLGDN